MIAAVFVVVVLDLIFGKGEGSLFDTFITALSLAVSSMSSYYLAFSHIVVASGVRRLGGGGRERETGALVRRSSSRAPRSSRRMRYIYPESLRLRVSTDG